MAAYHRAYSPTFHHRFPYKPPLAPYATLNERESSLIIPKWLQLSGGIVKRAVVGEPMILSGITYMRPFGGIWSKV